MFNLEGKRILVTGASSGIGKAFAQRASTLGASLIIFGRNIERLEETYNSLLGEGHEYYCTDLTDFYNLEQIISSSVASAGTINGFVHSAGFEKTVPFKASTPQVFREIFEINVFAGFEIARLLARKNIVDPTGASYIFISSVAGKSGEPGKVAYSSSKSALLAGVKSMALELAVKKIRCNCVLPGIVVTEMVNTLFHSIPPEAKQKIIDNHPLGLGKPEDVALLMCFLISDQARWITGSEYIIDGGYSA
jgi:NAD(P)-dependent dehydrogenase (short-subunit alcohol dehydrogenase family)